MIKTDKVIYHTRTQDEYDWLTEQLKKAECLWNSKDLIKDVEVFNGCKSRTCVRVTEKVLFFASINYYETVGEYSDYEFIEVSDIMGQPYKDTKGKPKLSLVPPQVLFDIAEVREYGNAKYPADGTDNWKRVDINEYKDALLRHTMKYIQNPKGKDEESGIEHYKHMACNIAFICEMERKDEQGGNM